MSKKHTLEYVKEFFEEQGCELLETEYKNYTTKMKYRCSCGNISKIHFGNFKNGRRCNKCGCKRRGEAKKFKLGYVKQFFKDNKCELLESSYKNNSVKMKYRCSCGNISMIRFADFVSGKRCRKCSGCEKYNFEYVKQYFRNNRCELLEKEYINNSYKMKYRCECGKISRIRFADFKKGNRCKACGFDKIRGCKHYLYNPNITEEERSCGRYSAKYTKWRTGVYKRDNYVCQNCFQRGLRLNAHHIESWDINKKLRFAKNNGITFCKSCHIRFHKIYGRGKNSRQQSNDFLNTKNLKID